MAGKVTRAKYDGRKRSRKLPPRLLLDRELAFVLPESMTRQLAALENAHGKAKEKAQQESAAQDFEALEAFAFEAPGDCKAAIEKALYLTQAARRAAEKEADRYLNLEVAAGSARGSS